MANQKKNTKTNKKNPAKQGQKVVSKAGQTKKSTVDTKKEIKKETVKVETVNKKVVDKTEKVQTTNKKVINKVEKVEPKAKTVKSFNLTAKQKDLISILLIVVVTVIALVATTVITSKKTPKLDIELPIALEGNAGFNEITYSEYAEKVEAKTPFIVVIVKDGCGYCDAYKPIVKEVAEEYNIPVNYINLSNATEEEYTNLSTSNSYLKKNRWGTPTTLFMYGSDVVDSIGGYVEKDTFVSFIEKNVKVEG